MSTTADILRAAAAGKTPTAPEHLASWVGYTSGAWVVAMEFAAVTAPYLEGLTDAERRSFLILVAEVIDNPQEGA